MVIVRVLVTEKLHDRGEGRARANDLTGVVLLKLVRRPGFPTRIAPHQILEKSPVKPFRLLYGQWAIMYCASLIMIAAAVGVTFFPLCAETSLMNAL
jgi:hypothetical protein